MGAASAPPTFDGKAAWELAMSTCAYTCAWGLLHVGLLQVVRRVFTIIPSISHNDWANRVISNLHAFAAASVSSWALFFEEPCRSAALSAAQFAQDVDTVHGDSAALKSILPVTLGYFTYDCIIMSLDSEVYGTEGPLLMMHHILSLLIWPVSFLQKAGLFYVIYFLAAEWSTLTVNMAGFFLPKHGIGGLPYKLSGVLLLLVFFVARVLPAPMIFWSLWASQQHWQDVNTLVWVTAMATIPIPPLLFLYWFARIVARVVDGVRQKSD